jgi:hypothetical protein
MTSNVRICNLALTRIGHSTIAAIGEDSKAGRLCALHYEPTRDAVLRAHPWNFAVRRADLGAPLSEKPRFGFARAFQLPTDCLRVLTFEPRESEWRVEGRLVLTDSDAAFIEYVGRADDPTLYDAVFIDAFAARLAAELAMSLTDNAQIVATLWDFYNQKLAEARVMDANEGTPRGLDADAWIASRF